MFHALFGLCFQEPSNVDYQVMCTYVDFYCTMLGFVNYKLYTMLGVHYPPAVSTLVACVA